MAEPAPHHAPAQEFSGAARLLSLDGLRGLAALSVVFGHVVLVWPVFWQAYQVGNWAHSDAPSLVKLFTYTPLHMLRASKEAVTIFFVLSGLVLALPILERKRSTYLSYVIRRISRLVPVFVLAMLVAFAMATWSAGRPQPAGSEWLTGFWSHRPGIADLLLTLGFIAPASTVDPPTWTLIHEMRISLVFPLLALAVIRRPLASFILSLLVTTALDIAQSHHVLSLNAWGAVPVTVQIVTYFVIGICIAKYRAALNARVATLGQGAGWSILLAAIVALFGSWILQIPPISFFSVGCVGAAVVVTMAAFWPPLVGFLQTSPCQYLGKISYSLYLTHLPILLFSVYLFPNTPRIPVVVCAVVAALAVCALVSHVVEWPLTRRGKALAIGKGRPA